MQHSGIQRFAGIAKQLEPQQGNELMRSTTQIGRQRTADNNRPDLPRPAHATQKRQAVHAIHLQIAHGDIHRPHLLKNRQRLAAVTGLKHVMATQGAKHAYRDGTLETVIFQDQDTQGISRH